jgi:hypothetical protein
MEDILLTATVAQRLGNSKRYGVYLPSRASLYEKDISFDSGNVWEYLTPGFTVDSEGSSTNSSESNESTPAQQIAIRYRAAHSFDLPPSRSSSDSSQDSEPDSWENSSQNEKFETDETYPPPRDLKAIYRQSRHQALRHTVRRFSKISFASHINWTPQNPSFKRPWISPALWVLGQMTKSSATALDVTILSRTERLSLTTFTSMTFMIGACSGVFFFLLINEFHTGIAGLLFARDVEKSLKTKLH